MCLSFACVLGDQEYFFKAVLAGLDGTVLAVVARLVSCHRDIDRCGEDVYRATTRRWVGDLPVCPREGDAMLSDRALSPVVHDHGEVIRLEESPRSVRYRQGCPDPG